MNEAQENRLRLILTRLTQIFPKELTTDTIRLYLSALEGLDQSRLDKAIEAIIAKEKRFPVPAVVLEYYREAALVVTTSGQEKADSEARAWLNDCAWVAENMDALGYPTTDEDCDPRGYSWFKRISSICTSCIVGNEWAEFRLLSPEKRAHFVNEWMIDAKVPRSVRERYDNAVRNWFTGQEKS